MIDFNNVTDIAIPQGNVIKIHETDSGRVLWQKNKKINLKWLELDWKHICYNLDTSSLGGRFIAITPDYDMGITASTPDILKNTERFYLKAAVSGGTSSGGVALNSDICRFIYIISSKGGASGTYLQLKSNLFFISGNDAALSSNYQYIYALSNDGRLAFTQFKPDTTSSTSIYCIHRHSTDNSVNDNFYIKTKAPVDADKVFITYSPEKAEYLVTGISGGTFTLPENFSSSTQINQNKKTLAKSLWVNELNNYFAITGSDKYVQYSYDGYSWNQSLAFSSGNVADIVYMKSKKMLCAIHDSNSKIALSSDGLSWQERNVPFSNALACSFSPAYDALCAVDNKSAYVSTNLIDWTQADLPSGSSVNFSELKHLTEGIFLAFKRKSTNMWLLVLEE